MKKFERQHNLFNNNDVNILEESLSQEINISKKVIEEWQDKIIQHQSPIFKYGCQKTHQTTVAAKYSYGKNLKWEMVLEINKYASYKKNVSCRNVQNFLKFLKNLVKPPKNHFKPLFGLSEVYDSRF